MKIPKFFYVLPGVMSLLISCSNNQLLSDYCASFPEFPVEEMKEIFEKYYVAPDNDVEDDYSLFYPGTVYPMWDSKEITVTRTGQRLVAEVPIASRYRLKFARKGAEGEIAEYGRCEDRIMIEKDEGSEESWIYLTYSVPEGESELGFKGVKIFTTMDGVLLRANHYFNGKKDGGVSLSGDADADVLSSKLDILARICKGIGFTKVEDSCPATKDSIDCDGGGDYWMFGGSSYGYYYDDDSGQGYGDITDPAVCTDSYTPYVPIGPTLYGDGYGTDGYDGYDYYNDGQFVSSGGGGGSTSSSRSVNNINYDRKQVFPGYVDRKKAAQLNIPARDCMACAKEILKHFNTTSKPGHTDAGDIARRNEKGKKVDCGKEALERGLNILISNIDAGKPVIVGVSESEFKTASGNGNTATQHFIVVTGYEMLGNGDYIFTYIETGRSQGHWEEATSPDNVLNLDISSGTFRGSKTYGPDGVYYDVTEIRPNQ